MSLVAWIILGIVVGFVASRLISGTVQDVVMDLGLGVVGAVVGGWLFSIFSMTAVYGFSLISLLVAGVGATLLLVSYHIVTIDEL